MSKKKVEINVRGASYTILTDGDPAEVLALASDLNASLEEILAGGRVSLNQGLVLVALDLADRAKRAEALASKYKSEIADYLEDAERAMTERDRYKRENEKLREKLGQ